MRPGRLRALAAAAASAVATGSLWLWLASSAPQAVPISVASDFVRHLHARRFADAFALSTGGRSIGASAAELERLSDRALCSTDERVIGTGPAQTRGNRLRRRLAGVEVEMPEVSVEFSGGCLLRVTVRHASDGTWRVDRFVSHAG